MTRLAIVVAVFFGLITPALSVLPSEVLEDAVLEQRARALSAEIRCLVCQNENIDESNAELARDLRVLVRERLVAGDTDQEVLNFLVDRYGEFVLLRPAFTASTVALWLGPFVLLFGSIVFLMLRSRRRLAPPSSSITLTDDEAARVKELLEQERL